MFAELADQGLIPKSGTAPLGSSTATSCASLGLRTKAADGTSTCHDTRKGPSAHSTTTSGDSYGEPDTSCESEVRCIPHADAAPAEHISNSRGNSQALTFRRLCFAKARRRNSAAAVTAQSGSPCCMGPEPTIRKPTPSPLASSVKYFEEALAAALLSFIGCVRKTGGCEVYTPFLSIV